MENCFLLRNKECDKNRESNFWGLLILYKENWSHYRELVKNDEDYYFNQFELETIETWSEKSYKEIELFTIISFKYTSRMVYLINFLMHAPEMYKDLNESAKNIIEQSINHMYMNENIVEKALYQTACQNESLFKEQVKIKSAAVFTSKNIEQHFKMIFDMIQNYRQSKNSSIYNALDAEDLEKIFYQSEQRGCTEQFINFLIDYCTGAVTFLQALQMFDYLKKFKANYEEQHYHMILTKMSNNSQYYNNYEKATFIDELEKMFLRVN